MDNDTLFLFLFGGFIIALCIGGLVIWCFELEAKIKELREEQ